MTPFDTSTVPSPALSASHRGAAAPIQPISRLMAEHHDELMVLQPEKGTLPQVFYLGMDERFTQRPDAEPGIWDVINEAGKELGYEFGH
jgi:tetrathionate reductase subunit B